MKKLEFYMKKLENVEYFCRKFVYMWLHFPKKQKTLNISKYNGRVLTREL